MTILNFFFFLVIDEKIIYCIVFCRFKGRQVVEKLHVKLNFYEKHYY